jgi:glucan phosphoethanolaminetransferase (alkaline phosphatase superfamily)
MDRKVNKKNQYLLVASLFVIGMFPSVLLAVIGEDSVVGTFMKKGAYMLISLVMLGLPLTLIRPKYFGYLVLVLFPFILFESNHILLFKTPSSQEAIAAITLTNLNEIRELILGNFLGILCAILLFIYLIFATFKIEKTFFLSKIIKKIIFSVFLFTFFALTLRNVRLGIASADSASEIMATTQYSFKVQFSKNFPSGIFMKLGEVNKGLKAKNKYLTKVNDFKFHSVKKDSLKKKEIYVLVIGETARKQNFGIYGYSKNTSPNLERVSNLISFKNAYTNSNVTSLSIPFILTRAHPKNASLKLEEPPVLNAFKESGFQTYWISNQQIGTGSIFGLYAQLADKYVNVSRSIDAAGFDENILPVFDEILKEDFQKKFIIIHTVGSHYRYNYRYPDTFEKFKPTLKKGISIENFSNFKNKEEIINSYDNSILYTDFILSEIIQKLNKTSSSSFMYFLSDHGENLFDTANRKFLHGYKTPSKYELEIPLFIWYSDAYKENYPAIIDNLLKNNTKRLVSSNTFHTLLDMANIDILDFKFKQSFANKKFDTLQKRTFFTVNKSVINIE